MCFTKMKWATYKVAPVLFASKKAPTPRPPTPIKGEGEKSRVYNRFDVSLGRGMKANSFA